MLRDLVYQYCGIFFQDDVAYLMEKRLAVRVQALGLQSFGDYYRHLRYGRESWRELEQIVELLTTNETYFFREKYQLRAFSEEILPELMKRKAGSRRLRIWSAGCSTGEEAYTIAMLLLETDGIGNWDLEIFANDISRRVIKKARKGVYGKGSFRDMEPYFLNKYFKQVQGGWEISEKVRDLVSFGQLNLLDDEMLALVGVMDVIFCRNVLIYFDKDSRTKVVETFYEKLTEGGYLLLGHSESLLNISTAFELVHLKNDMVYRKPVVGGVDESAR